MIESVLRNPFINVPFSREDFYRLCKNHLEYLKKKNENGRYNALIAMLETVVAAYENWYNSVGADDAGSVSKNMKLNMQRHVMVEAVDEIHNEVSFKFKRKFPDTYAAFFPEGKNAFNHLTLENTVPMISSFLTVCGNHASELDTVNLKALQDGLIAYENIEKTKNDSDVVVKTSSHEGDVLHDNVARVMHQVLLKLADIHFDDLDFIKSLYDAEYLNYFINAKKRHEKKVTANNKPA
jgi:hypothetical protein